MKKVFKGMKSVGVKSITMSIREAKEIIWNSRASEPLLHMSYMFRNDDWQMLINLATVIDAEFENAPSVHKRLVNSGVSSLSKKAFYKSLLKQWITFNNFSAEELRFLILTLYITQSSPMIKDNDRIEAAIQIVGDIFKGDPENVE